MKTLTSSKKSSFYFYKGKKHFNFQKMFMFFEGKPIGIIVNTRACVVDKNLKLGDSK